MPSILISTPLAPAASSPSVAQPPRRGVSGSRADAQARSQRLRLGHLSEALACRLGLDAETAQLLRVAAPLFDVVESDLTTAYEPWWPLTAGEERRRRQAQSEREAALVGGSRLPLFALAAEIALHHRERWDGHGYPQGLSGKAIPLSARIVAVVDYFDALTKRRRYRPARADDLGLAMLAEQAGTAFDPEIVMAFISHAPELIALRDRLDGMGLAAAPETNG